MTLRNGYRNNDTVAAQINEKEFGDDVRGIGIPRCDILVATKW